MSTSTSRRRVFRGGRIHSQTGSSSSTLDDDPKHKLQRAEAVLVLSRGPLTTRKLAALAGLADATEARTLIRQLNQIYDQQGRAFRAEEVAGGYQLLTRPQFAPYLRRLGHVPQAIRLSSPMLETLAIVAYRQPILRADIEAVRGVQSGELLRQLMEKDLVRISGRSEELGRPYLYSTTKKFLQVFGLGGTDALPFREWFQIETDNDSDPAVQNPEPSDPVPNSPQKESNVSIAIASPIFDATADNAQANVIQSGVGLAAQVEPIAAIDDEEDADWEDDEEEEWDDEEDDDDDAWGEDDDGVAEDDEDEDDDEEEWDDDDEDDDDQDGDWEEVDDDDDIEEDDDDIDEDDDDDEWVDDEDDDDWDDDDEEEF
ncbi:MAG: SMC-Scp complex subunit ScpB [Pirellulaceae bacterium]